MKNGLYPENGELIYYKDDVPYHAGIIKIGNDIYYISSHGRAVKGEHIVHGSMTNNIVKHGVYTFGDDYKMVKGRYVSPKKRKASKKGSNKRSLDHKIFSTLAGVLCLVAALFLITILIHRVYVATPGPTITPTESATTPVIKVVLPEFTEDVLLCSPAAKQEFDGDITVKQAVSYGNPYSPLRFEYTLQNATGILKISESADLSNAREYILSSQTNEILIHNLKTGTTYYYTVIVDGQQYPGSFHTAPSTRYISIDGLSNLRDIGGSVNLDGKTVKQGLLVRGCEIDGLVNSSYFLSLQEAENFRSTFGFVYDFDLRYNNIYTEEYTSRLGSDVRHKFYSAPQYGQIFNTDFHQSLRQIFSDLAKPANYPMYLHCTWGQDRTGTIIFLLQGILNMSQEDMIREYQRSGFVNNAFAGSTNMDIIINGLEPCAGDTVQEKIVTYLTTVVGVTEQEIQSIRDIFLS